MALLEQEQSDRFLFTLSQHDYSLDRKASIDKARHDQKVQEHIKGNLGDVIGDENIITSDGNQKVKVPVRGLELPHFRFKKDKDGGESGVGQGNGGTQKGDVVGEVDGDELNGKKAGQGVGDDYYEVELSIDELAKMMFEDLKLPFLKPKGSAEISAELYKFNDVRKTRSLTNLDKKRTLKEALKRQAMHSKSNERIKITDEDLRKKVWEYEIQPKYKAAIIAMRDWSGSMGEFEKYITRAFYFWMLKFLRSKYTEVDIVFIGHDSEAKEIDEEAFFHRSEGGGTVVSSAYKLANKIIDERFPVYNYNIYPFHFSDGDNWYSDNEVCVEELRKMLPKINAFGYGEIRQDYGAWGSWWWYRDDATLKKAFEQINDPRFIPVVIKKKEDVWPALKTFFSEREPLEELIAA